MRFKKIFSKISQFSRWLIFFWIAATPLVGEAGPTGQNIQIQVQAPQAISFTADQSSFTLTFSDFVDGAVSDIGSVTYSIQANDVQRTQSVVLGRLDSLFSGIVLEGDFQTYTKNAGNASLVQSQSGFLAINTTDVGLADKVIDAGSGRNMNGTFTIGYRARATQDLEAGNQVQMLTITFVDN